MFTVLLFVECNVLNYNRIIIIISYMTYNPCWGFGSNQVNIVISYYSILVTWEKKERKQLKIVFNDSQ